MSRVRRALRVESRSLENPKVPLSGRNIVRFLRGGGLDTSAGPVVSEQSALAYAAVFSCVRIRAEALGMVPVGMYEHSKDKGNARSAAASHPAHYLLNVQPNPEMTPSTFKQTLQSHLDTWGNGYARIEFDGAGRPRALWPLMPHATRAERTIDGYALRYVTTWRDSQVVLEPEEVLHIVGLGFDGIQGYSPVGLARQAIGIGLAAEEYTAGFYANGATFAGVFEHPEELSEDAEKHLRESLQMVTGAPNAFHPLILEEGMKWHQVSLPGEDALFLGLRKFQRREIAALYRVPNHMLNDVEDGATYSSIEMRSLEFVNYTLGASLVAWQQELTRKLGMGDPRFFAWFDRSELVQGDSKTRSEVWNKALNDGWMNPNEVRARENMPPRVDGDQFREPLNVGKSKGGTDEPGTGPGRKPDGFDDSHGGSGGGKGGGGDPSGALLLDPVALRERLGETEQGAAALDLFAAEAARALRVERDRALRATRTPDGWTKWVGAHPGTLAGYVARLSGAAELLSFVAHEVLGRAGSWSRADTRLALSEILARDLRATCDTLTRRRDAEGLTGEWLDALAGVRAHTLEAELLAHVLE